MNFTQIEAIIDVLRDSRLTEIEVRQGEDSLRLRRAAVPAPKRTTHVLQVADEQEPAAQDAVSAVLPGTIDVTAGLVGIFHHLREPVAEGAFVAERQVLGQIESMRLMNDCLAPSAGRIVAIRVEEEQPVEYGQILFEIVNDEEGTEQP